MTREEAIKWLEETIQDTDTYWGSCSEALQKELDEQIEVFLLAITVLRGPTREMVERMFRGCADCQRKTCVSCRRFGRVPERCIDCNNQDKWAPWNFCPVCGKPMTDEAVDMVMERLEALYDNRR